MFRVKIKRGKDNASLSPHTWQVFNCTLKPERAPIRFGSDPIFGEKKIGSGALCLEQREFFFQNLTVNIFLII